MSKNHTVGGYAPQSRNRGPKPKPASIRVPCSKCERKIPSMLGIGENDIFLICDCGAEINIMVLYNGLGTATVIRGTIEAVE